MDPKYAVDLSANRYQSLDSKRVVSTGGRWGSLEQTEGKDEADERGSAERERRRENRGSDGERVCLCVCGVRVCVPVSAGERTSKSLQSKGCFAFFNFFFFNPTKAPLALDPPPLPSDYSSVSPQRQPGLLDSVGHY